jgi:hypothetical protein
MRRFDNDNGTWLALGAVAVAAGVGVVRSRQGSAAIDLDALMANAVAARGAKTAKPKRSSTGRSSGAAQPFSPSESLQSDIDVFLADVSRTVARNKRWREERPAQKAEAQRALNQARFQDVKRIYAEIERRWRQVLDDTPPLQDRRHDLWRRLDREAWEWIDTLPPRIRKAESKILDKYHRRRTPYTERLHDLDERMDTAIQQLEQS